MCRSSVLLSNACWQADITMTLRQVYVPFFENEWLADGQADFSLFYVPFIYYVTVCIDVYCLMMTDSV